jgi:hypothetical protein
MELILEIIKLAMKGNKFSLLVLRIFLCSCVSYLIYGTYIEPFELIDSYKDIVHFFMSAYFLKPLVFLLIVFLFIDLPVWGIIYVVYNIFSKKPLLKAEKIRDVIEEKNLNRDVYIKNLDITSKIVNGTTLESVNKSWELIRRFDTNNFISLSVIFFQIAIISRITLKIELVVLSFITFGFICLFLISKFLVEKAKISHENMF